MSSSTRQCDIHTDIRNEVDFVRLALTGTRKSVKLRTKPTIGAETFRIISRRRIVMENREKARKQRQKKRDFDF
jgi:hypothetical protein